MQGEAAGGDVVDALPEPHGKFAWIQQRAAIQLPDIVVRNSAVAPLGHGEPPERAAKLHENPYSSTEVTVGISSAFRDPSIIPWVTLWPAMSR